MNTKKDIHKGGRPPKYSHEGFYEEILDAYEKMTIRQIAEHYKVSISSVNKWLRIGRERIKEKENKDLNA